MRVKALELDARLSTRLRVAERPGLLKTLAAILAHSGDSWIWLAGLVLVWLWGAEYWKTRAVVLATGVVATAVVVMVIKFTVRRRRPAGEWGGIYRQTDPHSFPSGHAARAAMLAVIAISLGPTWFAVLLVVWAPLVSLARIAMGLHYLSDVLAGMVLGVLMGLAVLYWYNWRLGVL
jgi:undecaprenyl-diphosphatase